MNIRTQATRLFPFCWITFWNAISLPSLVSSVTSGQSIYPNVIGEIPAALQKKLEPIQRRRELSKPYCCHFPVELHTHDIEQKAGGKERAGIGGLH